MTAGKRRDDGDLLVAGDDGRRSVVVIGSDHPAALSCLTVPRGNSAPTLTSENVDHYGAVDLAAAFALTARPAEFLGCGQTTDDLAEMTAMLIRPEDIVLWHDLDHLAGLLRCVAYPSHSASQTGQGQPGGDR